jgi:hypothetical protein
MKKKWWFVAVCSAAVALLGSSFAYAQQSQKDTDKVVRASEARALSDADLRRLKPVVNALKPPNTSRVTADTMDDGDPRGVMREDGPDYFADDSEAGYSERAFGTFGIPYTTTRVQDGLGPATGSTSASRLSTTYPYRTVGKLTFSAGYCSASVIRRGVIVTAAHCIQSFGSGNSIYTNFQFRPGHYGATGATAAQIAPYGTWSAWSILRPGSWAAGTDVGSGAARDNDLALIALRKDSSGRFIGDRVGKLGYGWNNYSFVTSSKTGNLRTAAVTTLGYPGLMDLGRIMQRTDGPTYTTTIANAGQLWQGSNFTGGSSGGPWVVNFSGRNAALSGGAVSGTAPVMAVIGVTSWGAADPNGPKDNYSSQFRQNSRYPNASYGIYGAGNIGSLMSTLCASAAPEGGSLASRGYCN